MGGIGPGAPNFPVIRVVVIHLSIIDIGTLVRYENQIESYMKNEEINELTAKLQSQSRFE